MQNAPNNDRTLPRFLTGLAVVLGVVLTLCTLLTDPTTPGGRWAFSVGWFGVVVAFIMADLTEPVPDHDEDRDFLVWVVIVFAVMVYLGVKS